MKLTLPTSIEIWVNKKKRIWLWLNWYRNAHFIVSNNIKKTYKELIKEQLWPLDKIELPAQVSLTFTYFNGTKRIADLDNWCSIACKFTQDAFTELELIKWDDYNYVKEVHFIYGWYDKNNWRIEVEIEDHEFINYKRWKREMEILHK